jgi:saccharopine dehydrogenase (NAD+, L-lysine-forming)
MAKVTVLGGCGAVGSVAVRTLVGCGDFSEVVIGDWNIEKGHSMARDLGPCVRAVQCDARDSQSVRGAIEGSNVVLNCVGPFYSTVKPILRAIVEAGIDYVDVCDDVDVTLEILAMHDQVRQAGIAALIGMGSSPGLTNIIARMAADTLLDLVEAIDIFHTHGGEPVEGAGVIGHRFHCMEIPIPMYLEGELRYVDYFGDDGLALRQTFDFPYIGPTTIYPYPHPEQVTLPQHIALRQVTNKGSVLPEPYYDLIRDLARLGLSSTEPVDVQGQRIVPHDFAIAYVLRERERILEETGFGQQRGCISVVVSGLSAGQPCEYRFHMASTSQALGEGTGIPAAIGTMLMQRGQVRGKGVLPPEACIQPTEFLPLALELFARDAAGKGQPGEGLIVERLDETGTPVRIGF